VITALGILVGVAYTLRVMQRVFFGETQAGQAPGHGEKHAGEGSHDPLPPISVPERIGTMMLIGASLIIGLYPRLLLDVIVPSLQSPLFEWLKKGGAP
jgi:NADH-quinone oxidoreductase subunit M